MYHMKIVNAHQIKNRSHLCIYELFPASEDNGESGASLYLIAERVLMFAQNGKYLCEQDLKSHPKCCKSIFSKYC